MCSAIQECFTKRAFASSQEKQEVKIPVRVSEDVGLSSDVFVRESDDASPSSDVLVSSSLSAVMSLAILFLMTMLSRSCFPAVKFTKRSPVQDERQSYQKRLKMNLSCTFPVMSRPQIDVLVDCGATPLYQLRVVERLKILRPRRKKQPTVALQTVSPRCARSIVIYVSS